jgi:hypothetical protein
VRAPQQPQALQPDVPRKSITRQQNPSDASGRVHLPAGAQRLGKHEQQSRVGAVATETHGGLEVARGGGDTVRVGCRQRLSTERLERLRLGDEVRVQVEHVDTARGRVDLVPAEDNEAR